MTTPDFLPSQVFLGQWLCASMQRAEAEFAAMLLVRALVRGGNQWRAVTREEALDALRMDADENVEPLAAFVHSRNPFFRPDPRELVRLGYAYGLSAGGKVITTELDGVTPEAYEFTEAGFAALAKHVTTPASLGAHLAEAAEHESCGKGEGQQHDAGLEDAVRDGGLDEFAGFGAGQFGDRLRVGAHRQCSPCEPEIVPGVSVRGEETGEPRRTAKAPDTEKASTLVGLLRSPYGPERDRVLELCDLYEQLEQAHQADLDDMRALISRVTRVYDHVTGGHVSDVLTDVAAVVQAADEHMESTAELAVECALERVKVWADDCAHSGHEVERACGEDLLRLLEEDDEVAGAAGNAVVGMASDAQARADDNHRCVALDVDGIAVRARVSPDATPETMEALKGLAGAAKRFFEEAPPATLLGARAVELGRRALRHYGADHQMRLLQEECGELIAAINQYTRGRLMADVVAAEVADVSIGLAQAGLVFGGLVSQQISAKLDRLEQLLKDVETQPVDDELFAKESARPEPKP